MWYAMYTVICHDIISHDMVRRGAVWYGMTCCDVLAPPPPERGQVDGLVAPKPGNEVRQGVKHHHLRLGGP